MLLLGRTDTLFIVDCEEIFVKKNRLWITIHLDTQTKEGKIVIQSKVQFVVREGGFTQYL